MIKWSAFSEAAGVAARRWRPLACLAGVVEGEQETGRGVLFAV
jgi:hypothetical protein